MLPIITLNVTNELRENIKLNWLLDFGSSLSLVDTDVIGNISFSNECQHQNLTVLGQTKNFKGHEVILDILFPNGKSHPCNLFSINNLSCLIKRGGIGRIIDQIRSKNQLSKSCPVYSGDSCTLHGIIGCDLLHLLPEFKICVLDDINVIELSDGVIPFTTSN